ncbi:MAG: IclR family transcriptional regulator [Azoarcus sp.]|jgi:DNA-binding IclR family transcriptional regulator|nr:IclR family transcriptional regulator [Azoarcus sp.]
MNAYTNAAQQRLLRLVLALFADVINGLAPGVLAKEIGCPASAITRDLANLRDAGLAERLASGAWRLTPRLPQQAVKVFTAINHAGMRLDEARQRYCPEESQ